MRTCRHSCPASPRQPSCSIASTTAHFQLKWGEGSLWRCPMQRSCRFQESRTYWKRTHARPWKRSTGSFRSSPKRRSLPRRQRPSAPSGPPTPPESLHIRIGLNAGEPIEEEGPDGRADLFGATVILAARIAALADGGEGLASDIV